MSEHDVVSDVLERLEWDEDRTSRQSGKPVARAGQITRRTALTGGAAGLAALLLEACGGGGAKTAQAASGSAASAIFGVNAKYHFTLIANVTTNTFFTPTMNGAADACKLLGCTYTWTGSETSNVGQMVNAFNTALSSHADGIGVVLTDATAFNKPVVNALAAGIPVVSFTSDVPNARLAYIGMDQYTVGQQVGERIKSLVPGGGDVAIFIATPGTANIQPRMNGAIDALKGTNVKAHEVASGAAESTELTNETAFVSSHKDFKGFFAVDGGSTAAVGQAIQKNGLKGKVAGGGTDLTPITEQMLAGGYIQFTVDQQPYLEGFFSILELYLYRASNNLTGTASIATGPKLVNQTSVKEYVSTKTRYEGTSTEAGVQKS